MRVTLAMLVEDLRRVAARCPERTVRRHDYASWGTFNPRLITERGGWNALCRMAGLTYGPRPRQPEITLDMFVEDLRAVARRLQVRRLSSTRYQAEGSYGASGKILKRNGQTWADACAAADLLPCGRGARGTDIIRCARCGHFIAKTSQGRRHCKACRRTLRRRQTCRGWQVDAA